MIDLKRAVKQYLADNIGKAQYKFILKGWTSLKDLNALSVALESKRFTRNLEPVVISRPRAEKVLIISPHPDDDIFSSGGTILKLRQGGCDIRVIYLTSGDNDTASKRESEASEVARRIGTKIEFWRYPIKGIKIDEEIMARIRTAYKETKADIIFIPFIADDHDDHRRSVQLFYEALRILRNLTGEIWAYQIYSTLIPNIVVDITEVMDEKIELINMWKSQGEKRNWAHYIRGLNAFNSRFLRTNEPRYAECFFVVPAKEYLELCGIYFRHPAKDLYYSKSYK